MPLDGIILRAPLFETQSAAKACGRVCGLIAVEKACSGHVDGDRLFIKRPGMERRETIVQAAHICLINKAALRSSRQVLLERVVIRLPIVNDDSTIEALNLVGVPIGMEETWT